MNRYKKLLNNSLIFAVGNFGSKIISLLMVPLYTFVLSTQQYGVVDLLTTTVSLFVPLISLSIGESVIRYTMDAHHLPKEQNRVLTNAIVVNLISTAIALFILPILMFYGVFGKLLPYFFLLMVVTQFQITISQFVRGVGLVKAFAINGLLMTAVTAGMNILLLVNLSMGLTGYMLSLIFANIFSILYLGIVSNLFKRIKIYFFDSKLLKKMSQYSVPLIPNTIMWWLINSSTRYLILLFIGTSSNGLFAVANKIPAILTMFTAIFQQAWQLSAFEEYNSKGKDAFFSKTMEAYYQFLFLSTSFLIPFLQPIVPRIVGESFKESWQIIPFLLLAVCYQSLSSFIGTNYTAAMHTKGVFTSSIIGAVLSVLINIILIPIVGLTGAGIGTAISFLIIFIIRYIDTKKFIDMKISYKKFAIGSGIIVIQIIFSKIIFNKGLLFTCTFLLFVILLLFTLFWNRPLLKRLISKIR
ncbi:lipopolysaccharide biosynthesis protein [Enterococcus hailinensis]|uniref:lipopolysaccharide biosynthesis protein n=1 Tax=Enterococcus hailinensis TaxID=3238988 RepID=UPI0038B3B4FA